MISIRQGLFRFESFCRVILPLYHDITGIPDQGNYLGWNIELLIFGSNS
jgi:hypothetical protein